MRFASAHAFRILLVLRKLLPKPFAVAFIRWAVVRKIPADLILLLRKLNDGLAIRLNDVGGRKDVAPSRLQ